MRVRDLLGEADAGRAVVYRNHYSPRDTDGMRLFTTEPRVVETPAPPVRPAGMLRSTYADWQTKPWAIEWPTAGKKFKLREGPRFATRDDAEAYAASQMPDANERAALDIVLHHGAAKGVADELRRRGFAVEQSDSQTTASRYLYVQAGDRTVKIRFSDHSKTVFLGSTTRSHQGDSFDFAVGRSKPVMVARLASLFRVLEDARSV